MANLGNVLKMTTLDSTNEELEDKNTVSLGQGISYTRYLDHVYKFLKTENYLYLHDTSPKAVGFWLAPSHRDHMDAERRPDLTLNCSLTHQL